MTVPRLLLRNLLFHWRGNLAILLGVAVGGAVLTGALLVGDSLRGSLRQLAEQQRGWVEYALTAGRFFREELAAKLRGTHSAPAILLQASVVQLTADQPAGPRVRKVVLLGVDERFWEVAEPVRAGEPGRAGVGEPGRVSTGRKPPDTVGGMSRSYWKPAEFVPPAERSVVLGSALARDLGAKVGDRILFSLEKVSTAPRESLLGRKDEKDVLLNLSLLVAAVLPDDSFGSRFTLSPGPPTPRNAFVPLTILQEEVRNQARHLPERPVNALLVAGGSRERLQADLLQHMTLEDYGLKLEVPRRRFGVPAPKYLSLESPQMFLPDFVGRAVQRSGLTAAPTLVYLVNNLSSQKQHLAALAAALAPPGPELTRWLMLTHGPVLAPYCVVAALETEREPPLGPFTPKEKEKLGDDEILVVEWENSPLAGVKPGERLTLTYFSPEEETGFRELTARFRLASHLPLRGPARDTWLTPQFPGITDRLTIDTWDPPFPFDRTRVREPDEQFWREHRTTPKAYITLAAGEKLWASRFGKRTSFRIIGPGGNDRSPTEADRDTLAKQLLTHLRPEESGLIFDDVRGNRLLASTGSQDFGLLFLGFSCFLIISALLLVGLLFRLNIDRRGSEIGLLLAVGWPLRQVRRLLLLEGFLLALLGAAGGCALALFYADLLLGYLALRWPGGLEQSFLRLEVTATSLAIGYLSAVLVSVLTILSSLRVLARLAPTALVRGVTEEPISVERGRRCWVWWVIVGSVLGAILFYGLGLVFTGHEARAGSFLGSGALLLTALLALVWWKMRRLGYSHLSFAGKGQASPPPLSPLGQGWLGLAALGGRNASRQPLRSLLTMGLLASAAFLVVAVQAFHRNASADFLQRTGGSGGFPLIGESDLPLFQDLNSPSWRRTLSPAHQQALEQVRFVPCRISAGDDASCLNLYRPRQPRLLGVPQSLIQRGGFRFAGWLGSQDSYVNPWNYLTLPQKDGAIPVFGEVNSVTWTLKSGLGGEITVTAENGAPVKLRIVGLLRDSVFQGELVMADTNFRKLFPSRQGFNLFLIEAPLDQLLPVRTAVEQALGGYGMAVTPSIQRLEQFLAVENTYLATFQALGGLGLLLGALGLAVVLLRSVWERRGELALLRALGFRRSAIGWLVLAENLQLLVVGLLVGTVAALLAVAPHLTQGGEVQWLDLILLLGLVLLAGGVSCVLAIASAVRAPLLAALRRE